MPYSSQKRAPQVSQILSHLSPLMLATHPAQPIVLDFVIVVTCSKTLQLFFWLLPVYSFLQRRKCIWAPLGHVYGYFVAFT